MNTLKNPTTKKFLTIYWVKKGKRYWFCPWRWYLKPGSEGPNDLNSFHLGLSYSWIGVTFTSWRVLQQIQQLWKSSSSDKAPQASSLLLCVASVVITSSGFQPQLIQESAMNYFPVYIPPSKRKWRKIFWYFGAAYGKYLAIGERLSDIIFNCREWEWVR